MNHPPPQHRPPPGKRKDEPADEQHGADATQLQAAADQLAHELANRIEPFDRLATAAGAGSSFSQALERLAIPDLIAALDPHTAQAILAALWPTGIDPSWWQTPLGRAVAGQLVTVTPPAKTVKVTEAARMLGMSHARVIQLADNGLLDRGEHGVTLAAVYKRIVHPGQPGRPATRHASHTTTATRTAAQT